MTAATLESARVGDWVYFAGERFPFTVQARDARFVVCTRPFAARRTVLYTVADLKLAIRGTDNVVGCLGYETREECERALRAFQGRWGGGFKVEVSHRNQVPLRVLRVRSRA